MNLFLLYLEHLPLVKIPSTGNPNVSIPGKPAIADDKFENGYFTSSVKTIIEKVNRISDNLISIPLRIK